MTNSRPFVAPRSIKITYRHRSVLLGPKRPPVNAAPAASLAP
jgi:hypothetical protein